MSTFLTFVTLGFIMATTTGHWTSACDVTVPFIPAELQHACTVTNCTKLFNVLITANGRHQTGILKFDLTTMCQATANGPSLNRFRIVECDCGNELAHIWKKSYGLTDIDDGVCTVNCFRRGQHKNFAKDRTRYTTFGSCILLTSQHQQRPRGCSVNSPLHFDDSSHSVNCC